MYSLRSKIKETLKKPTNMKTLFVTTDISEKLSQVLDNPASLNAKIVSQMQAGVAHFYFTKKDGSIREAYGTLNPGILSTFLGEPTEGTLTEPVPNSDQVFQRFYDLTADGEPKKKWRQFEISGLVCLF